MIRIDAAADYADIALGSKWSFTPGQERTFSFRLNIGSLPSVDGQAQSYFHMRQDPDSTGEALNVMMIRNGGMNLFGIMYRGGTNYATSFGHAICIAPFATGTTYHVVVHLAAAIQNSVIYVNGSAQTIVNSLAYQRSDAIVPTHVHFSDGYVVNGNFALSHFSMHNALLSTNDRAALSGDPWLCQTWSNLIAYFPLNEGAGTDVIDRSQNPTNAALEGTCTWETNPFPYPSYTFAKYEPPANRTLHGLGQWVDHFYTDQENLDQITNYEAAVGNDPAMYALYVHVDPDEGAAWMDLEEFYQTHCPDDYALNIGLMLWDQSAGSQVVTPSLILNGTWDARLTEIARQVKNIPGPVYIRPGFEFGSGNSGAHSSGWTNGAEFVSVWQYIVDLFNAEGANNVAWVWNTVNPNTFAYMDWYPGDDYVDWWGINYFTASQITNGDGFVEAAAAHYKPVLVCESCPIQNNGTLNSANWSGWFVPYFAKIAEYPHIKGFFYISDSWDRAGFYDDWPDTRMDNTNTNSTIRTNFASELTGSEYIHLPEKSLILPTGKRYLATPIIGVGSVTRTPDAAEYDHNASVSLQASAEFTAWGGDLTGNTNPANITMDADKTISALFEAAARSGVSLAASATSIVVSGEPSMSGQTGVASADGAIASGSSSRAGSGAASSASGVVVSGAPGKFGAAAVPSATGVVVAGAAVRQAALAAGASGEAHLAGNGSRQRALSVFSGGIVSVAGLAQEISEGEGQTAVAASGAADVSGASARAGLASAASDASAVVSADPSRTGQTDAAAGAGAVASGSPSIAGQPDVLSAAGLSAQGAGVRSASTQATATSAASVAGIAQEISEGTGQTAIAASGAVSVSGASARAGWSSIDAWAGVVDSGASARSTDASCQASGQVQTSGTAATVGSGFTAVGGQAQIAVNGQAARTGAAYIDGAMAIDIAGHSVRFGDVAISAAQSVHVAGVFGQFGLGVITDPSIESLTVRRTIQSLTVRRTIEQV